MKEDNNIQFAREEIVRESILENVFDEERLMKHIRKACAKYQIKSGMLKKVDLAQTYHEMLSKNEIEKNIEFERLLIKRKIRTISGVSVIAVMTEPRECPGKCVYCPGQKGMPKSYLDKQPAAARALGCDFDPYKQVWVRLETLKSMGHDFSKNEVIILGGTFSAHAQEYQEWFVKKIYDAFNQFGGQAEAKDLHEAKQINESADCRMIGLTIETRPDHVSWEHLAWLRYLGVTRIEIGVQSLDDKILLNMKRGHDLQCVREATDKIRRAGFKIVYHMMPGLPGATVASDKEMFLTLFSDPGYFPDHLKIYPTVVLPDSELAQWYEEGKYEPFDEMTVAGLLREVKKNIPPWVRIVRVMRDMPQEMVIAGTKSSNLRQLIFNEGAVCKCIRCREPKGEFFQNTDFVQREYKVLSGKELFLSIEDEAEDKILALVRLFLPSTWSKKMIDFFPILSGSALIRELHTYGAVVGVNKNSDDKTQHRGMGKKLMLQAEEIAKKNGYKKMAVIAGVGVREYYANLGYVLEDEYMVKNLV